MQLDCSEMAPVVVLTPPRKARGSTPRRGDRRVRRSGSKQIKDWSRVGIAIFKGTSLNLRRNPMTAHGRLFAAGSIVVALSLSSSAANGAVAEEPLPRQVIELEQDDPTVPGRGLGLTPDPEDRGLGLKPNPN